MKCIAPRCGAAAEVGALFCGAHLTAPTGTRGGWISAWRRAQARANGAGALDASAVARRLWIGSVPPLDRDLPEFDTLFLCAAEVQPAVIAFSREVVRVPLPDAQLSPYELKRALIGGKQVAEALRAGRRVLVTCYMGWNRSSLVALLGLGIVTRMRAPDLIQLARDRRHPRAMSNPHFCEYLTAAIDGRARRPASASAYASPAPARSNTPAGARRPRR